jgi:hypothetical protein
LTIIFSFVLVLAGCDLFDNKPEIDLLKEIDAEVAWANAPEITVETKVIGRGVVTRGATRGGVIKKGYPFDLEFSPSTDYGFTGWYAWLADANDSITDEKLAGLEKLEKDKITFSYPENAENTLKTSVTIHFNPGKGKKIVIEARAELVAGARAVAVKDMGALYPLQIKFSKPMDPKSFAGNFTIEGAEAGTPFDINRWDTKFDGPTLSVDGKILTFWYKQNAFGESLCDIRTDNNITISLSGSIKDANDISIERNYSFDYYILKEGDGRQAESACFMLNGLLKTIEGAPPFLGDINDEKSNFNQFSGKNSMLIKTDSGYAFNGDNFTFDPASHNVFTKNTGNYVYIVMVNSYDGAYLPRAFKVMESVSPNNPGSNDDDYDDYDNGETFEYSGEESEIVTDLNITIPTTKKFGEYLARTGSDKYLIYPLTVIKYKLIDRNFPSGNHKVYIACWPLQSYVPPQNKQQSGLTPNSPGAHFGDPSVGLHIPLVDGGYSENENSYSNPARFFIEYRIP